MLTPIQKEISELFASFKDIDDKWKYLLNLANEWPEIDQSLKDSIYIVPGCSSTMYLVPQFNGTKLHFEMDVDNGLISKGLGVLALKIYNDLPPADILKLDKDFFKQIGLDIGLTPTRSNGFASILSQIYKYARIFDEISK